MHGAGPRPGVCRCGLEYLPTLSFVDVGFLAYRYNKNPNNNNSLQLHRLHVNSFFVRAPSVCVHVVQQPRVFPPVARLLWVASRKAAGMVPA